MNGTFSPLIPFGSLPPATKLGQGYVFTRVCDSVHKGGGVVSQHALQMVSQHALHVSRPTHPRGKLRVWAGGVQAHTQGGAALGGVPAPGGWVCLCACSRGSPHPPPPDGYCCGQYASYWNAFLFI